MALKSRDADIKTIPGLGQRRTRGAMRSGRLLSLADSRDSTQTTAVCHGRPHDITDLSVVS